MKKVFFFTLIFLISAILIVSYFYFSERVYPGTYLGKKNISFFKKTDISAYLEKSFEYSFNIQVRNKAYPMRYRQMGIALDKGASERLIYENNRLSFPKNIIAFFRSINGQKLVLPGFIFSESYSDFIDRTRFDFTQNPDKISVDNGSKTLALQDNEVVYKIDEEHLKSLILFHFGEKDVTIEPRLVQLIKTDKQEKIIAENKKLSDIFSRPIEITVDVDGKTFKAVITTEELKTLFDIAYNNGEVTFSPRDERLSYLIEAKVDPHLNRNTRIDMKALKGDVLSAFLSRAKGLIGDSLLAKTTTVPLTETDTTTTHGEIADRYIEVSIVKQKMYVFDKGIMLKSYPISTGLYYPTPVGHFHIMNKALEGYSDIYNVYMPYWMAFYYGWAGGQDAYFGIHELPYWYAGGERKQRPREFIGSPHTGGCISLDIGAAKEVYDFSFVGMDVVVYE
ncbi:L,D-transpeptidase family protein [Candidatus Roizmanbacteria bacterium]|nr:L,D-transpeptidase family protein [Candidatus Roizmanbacteria bacterium]